MHLSYGVCRLRARVQLKTLSSLLNSLSFQLSKFPFPEPKIELHHTCLSLSQVIVIFLNWTIMSTVVMKLSRTSNRPFATNDYMVQSPPCWRASSLYSRTGTLKQRPVIRAWFYRPSAGIIMRLPSSIAEFVPCDRLLQACLIGSCKHEALLF